MNKENYSFEEYAPRPDESLGKRRIENQKFMEAQRKRKRLEEQERRQRELESQQKMRDNMQKLNAFVRAKIGARPRGGAASKISLRRGSKKFVPEVARGKDVQEQPPQQRSKKTSEPARGREGSAEKGIRP